MNVTFAIKVGGLIRLMRRRDFLPDNTGRKMERNARQDARSMAGILTKGRSSLGVARAPRGNQKAGENSR